MKNDAFALFSSLPTPVWVKFRHKLKKLEQNFPTEMGDKRLKKYLVPARLPAGTSNFLIQHGNEYQLKISFDHAWSLDHTFGVYNSLTTVPW
jgi:hypothetical protein